jgi:cell division septal protein FtsQ
MSGPFLPDRLRPATPRRRNRRPLWLLLVVLAAVPAAIPWWRVQAVELTGYRGFPVTVHDSLGALVGRSPLTVDPQWVRRQVEVWPEVATVDVRLELPSTLTVHTTPAVSHGSVPSGRRWRAVTEDGGLAGPLDQPQYPVLVGFSCEKIALATALGVARRVAVATGAVVEEVRVVTPTDFEVRLRPRTDRQPVTVRVQPTQTKGERFWCERFSSGEWEQVWADLRWEDRVIVGGGR